MADDRQPKLLVDATINDGHSRTAISFIVAGIAAYYGMRAELQNIDQLVAKIDSTLQQKWHFLIKTGLGECGCDVTILRRCE